MQRDHCSISFISISAGILRRLPAGFWGTDSNVYLVEEFVTLTLSARVAGWWGIPPVTICLSVCLSACPWIFLACPWLLASGLSSANPFVWAFFVVWWFVPGGSFEEFVFGLLDCIVRGPVLGTGMMGKDERQVLKGGEEMVGFGRILAAPG